MIKTDNYSNIQQKQTALLEICANELLSWKPLRTRTKLTDSDRTALTALPIPNQQVRVYTGNIPNTSLAVRPRIISPPKSSCHLNGCGCSCHDLDVISGTQWVMKYPRSSWWGSCGRRSCVNFKRASFWLELSRFGIQYAILASLDIMWGTQHISISPSLQMKRVVNLDSPAFELIGHLRWGSEDWVGGRSQLADFFEFGKASPFDILPDGTTMVEVRFPNALVASFLKLINYWRVINHPWPNGDTQLQLLEFLVNSGAPINTLKFE